MPKNALGIDEIPVEEAVIDEIPVSEFENQTIDEIVVTDQNQIKLVRDNLQKEALNNIQQIEQQIAQQRATSKKGQEALTSEKFKKITPTPKTIDEGINYHRTIEAKKEIEKSKNIATRFTQKLGEIVSSGSASIFQGTLGTAESIFRTPDAINRGVSAIEEMMPPGSLPPALQSLKFVTDPKNRLKAPIKIGDFSAGNFTDIADEIKTAQKLLPVLSPIFEKNSELSQQADNALKETLKTGNPSKLMDVILNPTALSVFIGQSVPSLTLAVASGGHLGFLGWLEAMEVSNDASEFEKETGIKIPNNQFLQAMTQAAIINALLEKMGVKQILKPLKGGSRRLLKAAVFSGGVEGLTESLQALNTNLSKKFSYDEKQDILEGVLPSALGGAGAGAGASIGFNTLSTDPKIRAEQIAEGQIDEIPAPESLLPKEVKQGSNATESPKQEKVIAPPTGRGGITPPELLFGNWKDKPAFNLSRETLERNIEDIVKDPVELQKVKEFLVEPIKSNETARAEFITNMRTLVEQEMNRLNIKNNSLDDKLVQRFGEGNITKEELRTLTKRGKAVETAAKFFREQYDELLDTINSVRDQFGYEPIPKRKDYFRHFQELGSFINNFGLLFRENDLPTEISGLTQFFKPGKPFTSAELKRLGGEFKESAIGGFDNYLEAVSKQIFHTDSVQRVRVLEKYIRTTAEEGLADLPNFVSNLSEYGNLLSGKKSDLDRGFERYFGRPFYSFMNRLRRQTSANMIAGNVSSALTNFAPFNQALSTTDKQSFLKGLFEATITPFNKNTYTIDGVKSELFSRRYPKESISKNILQKAEEKASSLFKLIDMFSAKTILSGKYYEGIKKGLNPEEAMKEADTYTGKILADRSWGQLPNIFSAKSIGFFTQFQVEINNILSSITKDVPRQFKGDIPKIVGAMTQFAIYSSLFNHIFEKMAGRRPVIDPIYALLTLFGWTKDGKDKPFPKRLGVAGTDFFENIPFLPGLTQGRLPVKEALPDVKSVLEGRKKLSSELFRSGATVALPFGGGQIRKTIRGLLDYSKGASTTAKGRIRYDVEQSLPNLLRAVLFGPSSFPEAVEHYAKK